MASGQPKKKKEKKKEKKKRKLYFKNKIKIIKN